MDDKIKTYQDNVRQYLNIREQTMGTFSLVFEATESNKQMINESILLYYLSKCFQIPKEKFRILNKSDFVIITPDDENNLKNVVKKPAEPIAMTKICIEIS